MKESDFTTVSPLGRPSASWRHLNRRYSESEFRAILAKAVEEAEGVSPETPDGLSLAEIQEIGAQVGIGPLSLERAARSVAAPGRGISALLAGAPVSVTVSRCVEGELDSVPATEILSVIRTGMGKHGEASELKSLLEWRFSGELGSRTISLSTSDGTTTVQGIADLANAAIVTHVPLGLLGLLASGVGFANAANNGSAIGMIVTAGLLPAAHLLARRIYGLLARSERARLGRVVEELTGVIGASASDGSEPAEAS